MDTYLIMMYVSLDQEKAIKNFCLESGWPFYKPDLRYLTDKVGAINTSAYDSEHIDPKLTESKTFFEQDISITNDNVGQLNKKTREDNGKKKSKVKTGVHNENVEQTKGDHDLMDKIAEQQEMMSENEGYDTGDVDTSEDINIGEVFTCKHCSCSFKYHRNLLQHMRNKHKAKYIPDDNGKLDETKIYTCNYCSCTFKKYTSIPRHMRNKHGLQIKQEDAKYTVTISKSPKVSKKVLKQNSQTEDCLGTNQDKDNTPTETLDGSSSFHHLTSDVEEAGDNPDLIDKIAEHQEVVLKNEDYVIEDIVKHEISPENMFKCSYCKCSFKFNKHLQWHLRNAHNEPLVKTIYPCEYCIETFTSFVKFRRHLRVKHNKTDLPTKKFVCEVCGKIFKRADYLKVHRDAIHLGVRRTVGQYDSNIICEFCGKEFKRKCHLDEHRGRKHGVKDVPFHACTLCPKKFARPSKLEFHIKKEHEKSKTFECEGCKKKYYTKLTLSKHMQLCQMKEDAMFPCEKCGKKFKTAYNVQLHMQAEHSKPALECPCGAVIKWKSSVTKHKRRCSLANQHMDLLENMTSFSKEKGNNDTFTLPHLPKVDINNTDGFNKEQYDTSITVENVTTKLGTSTSQMMSNPTAQVQTDKEIGSEQSQFGVGKDVFLDLVNNVEEEVLETSTNTETAPESNVIYVIMNK